MSQKNAIKRDQKHNKCMCGILVICLFYVCEISQYSLLSALCDDDCGSKATGAGLARGFNFTGQPVTELQYQQDQIFVTCHTNEFSLYRIYMYIYICTYAPLLV